MENKTKYEIVKSEGCLSFGTTVNGKDMYGEYNPMTPVEILEFVDYLCEKFKQELKDNTVSIDDLIGCFQYDESETEDSSCETCGDSVTTTTWLL
jgi:hypothetical protein